MMKTKRLGFQKKGTKSDAIVEFVDIYPSLVDICGLPMPDGLEGRSFQSLIDNPHGFIKKTGCSWYPKGGYLGVAMRTDRWRFVEWRKTGAANVYELYDHQNDPRENKNLVNARCCSTPQERAADYVIRCSFCRSHSPLILAQ